MKPIQYRFDGLHVKEFMNDQGAFDEAVGWHDDREAGIEKMIDGDWCPFVSEPFVDVAGWKLPSGVVISTDDNKDPITNSMNQYIDVSVNHLEHLRMKLMFGKVPAEDVKDLLAQLHLILSEIKKLES